MEPELICDFCSEPGVIGFIPMESFSISISGNSWHSEGDWAVCEVCHTLLQASRLDEIKELSERVIRRTAVREGADPELAEAACRLIQKEFFKRWGARGAPSAIPLAGFREEAGSSEDLACEPGPIQFPILPKAALKLQTVLRRGLRNFGAECLSLAEWANPRTERQSSWSDLKEAVETAPILLWDPPVWNAAIRGSAAAFERCDLRQLSWPVFPQIWIFPMDKPPAGICDEPTLEKLHVPNAFLGGILVMGCVSGRSSAREHAQQVERCGLQVILIYWSDQTRKWAMGEFEPEKFDLDIALPRLRFLEPVWHGQEWTPPVYQAAQAALSFLALPFVSTSRQKFNRQNERSFEKANGKLPDVKTITLRRPERKKSSGESEPREWSCSWMVSGHWRRQPYPSTGEVRPLYLSPYVKGPEDKPLRLTDGTVYRVKR